MTKVRTILYAEDDPVVLTAHQNRLQLSGFHVIPAHDGLEAIRRLSLFVPDLVLLDLMLPKFKGEEVLHFIRANPHLAKVPVIILSTNSVSDMAQEHLLESAHKRLLKSHCTAGILQAAILEVLDGPVAETACNVPSVYKVPSVPGIAGVNAAHDEWRRRALEAEARAEQAQAVFKASVVPQLAQSLREAVMQGLAEQRSELLQAQQVAAAEISALVHRLDELKVPMQERLRSYEERIGELEKDLAERNEENRELLKLKIEMTRRQLEAERTRNRVGFN